MLLAGEPAARVRAASKGAAGRAAPSVAAASSTMPSAVAADGDVTSPARGTVRPATDQRTTAVEAGAAGDARGVHPFQSWAKGRRTMDWAKP